MNITNNLKLDPFEAAAARDVAITDDEIAESDNTVVHLRRPANSDDKQPSREKAAFSGPWLGEHVSKFNPQPVDSPNVSVLKASAAVTFVDGKSSGQRLLFVNAGKRFYLDDDGVFDWKSSPQQSDFYIDRRRVETPEDLIELIQGLEACDVVCWSTFNSATATQVSAKTSGRVEKYAKVTARTKQNMAWPAGRAVFAIDVDGVGKFDHVEPTPATDWTPASIEAKLLEACPKLKGLRYVWSPSSSSNIRHPDGTILKSLGGQRFYFLIEDGKDIERASKALIDRLWSIGCGFKVLSDGDVPAILDRSLIDAAMYKVNQIDYVAKPTLDNGLAKFDADPVIKVFGGGKATKDVVDTRKVFGELKGDDAKEVAAARQRSEKTLRSIRNDIVADSVKAEAETTGETLSGEMVKERAEKRIAARDAGILSGSDIVYVFDYKREFADKKDQVGGYWSPVTIETVLADPERFNKVETLTPGEPWYRDFAQTGLLFTVPREGHPDDKPTLFCQAHGGSRYRLMTAETVDSDEAFIKETQTATANKYAIGHPRADREKAAHGSTQHEWIKRSRKKSSEALQKEACRVRLYWYHLKDVLGLSHRGHDLSRSRLSRRCRRSGRLERKAIARRFG